MRAWYVLFCKSIDILDKVFFHSVSAWKPSVVFLCDAL